MTRESEHGKIMSRDEGNDWGACSFTTSPKLLSYVTELTDRIRARSSPDQDDGVEDSAEFVSFFPDFVWTLREMTLKMEVDGHPITADEYLEISLKLKEGTRIIVVGEKCQKNNILGVLNSIFYFYALGYS